MALGIITAIGTLLTLALGIWKWVKRMKKEERRIADESKAKLDAAHNGGNESDVLDAWDRINRV